MRVIEGDAIEALRLGEVDVLGHQVNLRGVMGAGIAKRIRDEFPNAYTEYRRALREGSLSLGGALFVEVLPGRWVAHLAGQRSWGRGVQTDYEALRRAMESLCAWASERGFKVGLPFGIGCGLGGGDWSIVSGILEQAIPDATLYRLPGRKEARSDG